MTEAKKDAPFPTEWDEDIGETDPLESRAFYEYMQAYRHSRFGGLEFEEVKTWLRSLTAHSTGIAEPVIRDLISALLTAPSCQARVMSRCKCRTCAIYRAYAYLSAPAVQSEPSDAALIAQRDAWKAEAEHQYGRCWQANGGEDDYPVVGALDAYVAKKYAALAQPVVPTPPTAQPVPAPAQAVEASDAQILDLLREVGPTQGTQSYFRQLTNEQFLLFARKAISFAQPVPAPAQAVEASDWTEPHPPSRQCICPACIPSFDDRFAAVPAVAMTDAIRDVLAERKKQDEQWGGPEHDDEHNAAEWLAYIEYQVDKSYSTPYDDQADRQRFIKIAALAVAAVESIDRRPAPGAMKETK